MYSFFVTILCAHLARIRPSIVTFVSVVKFIKLEHFVIRFFLSLIGFAKQLFNSFLQERPLQGLHLEAQNFAGTTQRIK